jgi:bacterioferritin
MKGNQDIIDTLNARLSEELAAINQYFLHAEMCEDWGYGNLHGLMKMRSIDEMKHAEKLIERILFLDGRPIVSNLANISIGAKVDEMHQKDWDAERDAIQKYNESIALCTKLNDHGTKTLLEEILKDEESHIDWIEEQQDQIEHIGIQRYLNKQISKD